MPLMNRKPIADRPENAKLVSLATRLEAGEDPQRIAGELRRLAQEMDGKPPGRPKDPPRERILRRVKRAFVAEEIYRGTFPKALCKDQVACVERAKGRRDLADTVAGVLVNASASAVAKARKACIYEGQLYPLGVDRRGPIMEQDHWEEYKALLLLYRGK
jgi:hypothetical protein